MLDTGDRLTAMLTRLKLTAIRDRLLHHSHVVTIRGDSYRLKEKRRSGLLRTAAPEPATASTKA